jgi:hypothetical protein
LTSLPRRSDTERDYGLSLPQLGRTQHSPANCLSPGFVRTELGREATGAFRVFLRLARPFQSSPEAGAQTSVYLATSPQVAQVSGRYFEKSTPAQSSALSQDPAAAKRLWQLSTQLSGLDAELPTTG